MRKQGFSVILEKFSLIFQKFYGAVRFLQKPTLCAPLGAVDIKKGRLWDSWLAGWPQ